MIAQVRTLVQSREGVWNPVTLAGVQGSLAVALARDGEESGKNASLVGSIALYRKVLNEFTRARAPLQWAGTQINLGVALEILGERESATGRGSISQSPAYPEALKELTRARAPLDWAMTQNNLGNALGALGERESGTLRIKEAVVAFRNCLA